MQIIKIMWDKHKKLQNKLPTIIVVVVNTTSLRDGVISFFSFSYFSYFSSHDQGEDQSTGDQEEHWDLLPSPPTLSHPSAQEETHTLVDQELLPELLDLQYGCTCHHSCFGVYTSVGFEPLTVKNTGALLLLSQMVKLSGWSHGLSRALSHGLSRALSHGLSRALSHGLSRALSHGPSHDWAHVLSTDHDESSLMTRHVASLYLSYLSATLVIGCHTPLVIALPSHTSGWLSLSLLSATLSFNSLAVPLQHF